VGTTYAATQAVDLTLGYYNVKRSWTDGAKPDATIDRVIGFAEYKLSTRTLAFLEIDHNKWGGDVTQFQNGAANKAASTGLTLGLDHTF
jgi:predicted porin